MTGITSTLEKPEINLGENIKNLGIIQESLN